MIRRLAFILILLLMPTRAFATHVVSKELNLDIKTLKVATIEGDISRDSALMFVKQMDKTQSIPGDRLILINSSGGEVTAGDLMIAQIERDKSAGTRTICVVERRAHSMAFNILTHCDVRLAAQSSIFVFHKIAVSSITESEDTRLTPNVLRKIADDLEREDETYRRPNMAALHMSPADYDMHCEQETVWLATALLARGYLHGLASLQK